MIGQSRRSLEPETYTINILNPQSYESSIVEIMRKIQGKAGEATGPYFCRDGTPWNADQELAQNQEIILALQSKAFQNWTTSGIGRGDDAKKLKIKIVDGEKDLIVLTLDRKNLYVVGYQMLKGAENVEGQERKIEAGNLDYNVIPSGFWGDYSGFCENYGTQSLDWYLVYKGYEEEDWRYTEGNSFAFWNRVKNGKWNSDCRPDLEGMFVYVSEAIRFPTIFFTNGIGDGQSAWQKYFRRWTERSAVVLARCLKTLCAGPQALFNGEGYSKAVKDLLSTTADRQNLVVALYDPQLVYDTLCKENKYQEKINACANEGENTTRASNSSFLSRGKKDTKGTIDIILDELKQRARAQIG